MNALSEQCEVLRLWAKQLREGEPILASDLREAADTILNLRDTAQQAQDENAKLRDERDRMYKANVEKNGEILRLLEENAKLRELVRDMYFCNDETCTDCEHHDYSGEGFWCKRGVGWKKVRMRELGVVE